MGARGGATAKAAAARAAAVVSTTITLRTGTSLSLLLGGVNQLSLFSKSRGDQISDCTVCAGTKFKQVQTDDMPTASMWIDARSCWPCLGFRRFVNQSLRCSACRAIARFGSKFKWRAEEKVDRTVVAVNDLEIGRQVLCIRYCIRNNCNARCSRRRY